MPTFSDISINDVATTLNARDGGSQDEEYEAYIQQLRPAKAGMLEVGTHENLGVVRARLSGAARRLGIALIIRRTGRLIVFWVKPEAEIA